MCIFAYFMLSTTYFLTLNGESSQTDHLIPEQIDQLILLIIRIMGWSLSIGKWWSISSENVRIDQSIINAICSMLKSSMYIAPPLPNGEAGWGLLDSLGSLNRLSPDSIGAFSFLVLRIP